MRTCGGEALQTKKQTKYLEISEQASQIES